MLQLGLSAIRLNLLYISRGRSGGRWRRGRGSFPHCVNGPEESPLHEHAKQRHHGEGQVARQRAGEDWQLILWGVNVEERVEACGEHKGAQESCGEPGGLVAKPKATSRAMAAAPMLTMRSRFW